MKSVSEMGADSGGSGTGGRRLWNVIVLEQKPVFGSTKLAIRMEGFWNFFQKRKFAGMESVGA